MSDKYIDVEEIRNETPNCQDKLFMDSAGSSLMPKVVVEKIKDYLTQEEKLGGYRTKELQEAEIRQFYVEAAKLINCEPRNIAFAHHATDAYSKALSSISFNPGEVIITSNDDYISNQLHFITLQKRYGIQVVRPDNLENGDIDLADFKELVNKHNPKLVAITHIPTNSGLIQPVAEIGEICHEHDILYLIDACQSIGQIPVDVKDIKCDFLSATGRKFLRGPRGSGFLFVSDRLLNNNVIPLYIDMRGAFWTAVDQYQILDNAQRFESWELPYTLLIGFKEAINYANTVGIKNIHGYNQQLMDHFRSNLNSIEAVKMLDKGTNTANILTFIKNNISLDAITQALHQNDLFFSVSRKEWALLDFTKKGVDWAIRLSPHYFNTIEEVDRVTEIIREI